MKRGVARFDLLVKTGGEIAVNKVTLKNLATEGYLISRENVASPANAKIADWSVTFDQPLLKDSLGLVYVYEQAGTDLAVDIEVQIGQKTETLKAALPKTLKRNAVYTLTVRKDAVSADLELVVEEWQDGGETGLAPDMDGTLKIDWQESELPEGAYIEDDMLVLTSEASEFLLTVDCDTELEFDSVSGIRMTLDKIPAENGTWDGKSRFRVHKSLLPPGHEEQVYTLFFRRKGLQETYEEDQLRIKVLKNPILVNGALKFDAESLECDFPYYIENELGSLTLPEGFMLEAACDENDPWMKVVPHPTTPHTFRVIGGWRPNDPKADGREQKAALIVRRTADNTETERYYVKRRNFGLPVVSLNGIWWCKYNALGNSTDFNDQILCGHDPALAAGQSVAEYLSSCTDEDFLKLWNSAYLGNNGKGLETVWKNNKFTMPEWYDEQVHINLSDPQSLAPTGYEMPTFTDWKNLFRGGISIPENEWNTYIPENFNRNPEYETGITRSYRNDTKLNEGVLPGQMIITIRSMTGQGSEPLVFYGAGCQWNNNDVHHDWLLIAGKWEESGVWGWAFRDSGSLLTTTSSAANNTRTLRFKKSDVEYIY